MPAGVGMAAIVAVVRRPTLWLTAASLAGRIRPDQGHDIDAFLCFRNQTQRGGDGLGPPDAKDLVQFVMWAKKWDQLTKGALN